MIRTRIWIPMATMAMLVLLSWTFTAAVAQHNHGGGQSQQEMGGMGNSGQQMAKIKTGSFKSRVIEMKEGEIVVEGKYEGKVQKVTLRTDSTTKMEGQIDRGSEVKVSYRQDLPGNLFATTVKGAKQKKS